MRNVRRRTLSMNDTNPYEPTSRDPLATNTPSRLTFAASDAIVVAVIFAVCLWLFVPALEAARSTEGNDGNLPFMLQWIPENVGTAFFVLPVLFSFTAIALFCVVRRFASANTRKRMPWVHW